MSLYKDASLVMLPSAYKDGKLYSIRPTDGSGDFTFSRGTNLSATRVNASQLIEKGRENVLLYSQDFSQGAWSKTNLSLTANQTDPLGGTNAFLFTSTSASGNLFVQSLSNQNKVCSIYAKAGNRSIFAIVNNAYGNGATFNLSAKTAVSSGQGSLAVIEDVGNGWFRCSVYFSSGTQFLVVLSDVNGNGYSNGDTISFFGSQMELGTIATPYIETGASTAQAGILENTPRLDYSGGASCPSLLLEPQRSNFIPHSEHFSDWLLDGNGDGQSVTANYAISPEGVQNAYRLQLSIINGTYSRIRKSVTDSYSGAGVFSVYLKTNDGSTKTISMRWGGSGAVSKTITSEWQRFDVSGTAIYTLAQDHELFIGSAEGDSDVVDLSIYGAMQESGNFSTSYIPTYGVSQTRAEESATTASSDLISTQAFTMFFEHKALGISGTSWAYALEMADGSDEIEFYVNGGFGMNIYLGGNGGYIFGASSNDGYRAGLASKVALSYDGDKLSYFINGSLYNSATGVSFSDVNTYLNLRSSRNIALKQSLVFPTALTDSEAIALTTI